MPRTSCRRSKAVKAPPVASSASAGAAAAAAAMEAVSTGATTTIFVGHAVIVSSRPSTTSTKKRSAASTPKSDMSSCSVAKEKRAYRYRSSCPQALKERLTRAKQQRMYLISKEEERMVSNNDDDDDGAGVGYWKFALLGSTGNVYEATLGHVPTCTCPDFATRGDLCKHLIFVLLRVVGLSPDDPLAYQKAYLTTELQDLVDRMKQRERRGTSAASNTVWANERVRAQYSKLGKDDDDDNKDEGVKRQTLEQDCPICLEDMSNCALSQVTYCKVACGMNFHTVCINEWIRALSGGSKTCPNCRAVEEKPAAAEGFVNMARLQGQSPVRDTSTYHQFFHSESSHRSKRRRRF